MDAGGRWFQLHKKERDVVRRLGTIEKGTDQRVEGGSRARRSSNKVGLASQTCEARGQRFVAALDKAVGIQEESLGTIQRHHVGPKSHVVD